MSVIDDGGCRDVRIAPVEGRDGLYRHRGVMASSYHGPAGRDDI